MRSIDQIIKEAYAALAAKRTRDQRAADLAADEQRAENRRKWQPIIEGIRDRVPAELQDFIHYDELSTPDIYEGYGEPKRSPVRIVLPTSANHTVFGYWFNNEKWGFIAGQTRLSDEHDEIYFAPTSGFYRRGAQVFLGEPFEIALAKTMESNLNPRRSSRDWSPEPSRAEQLESLIREIARSALSDREE